MQHDPEEQDVGADGGADGGTLRLASSSPGWRRFYAGCIALIGGFTYVSFAVDSVSGLTQFVFVVLLVGQVTIAVGRFGYAEFTREGVHLQVLVQRRSIPWSEVKVIELGGRGLYGRAPQIGLHDGAQFRSAALGGLAAGSGRDPAALEHLERVAGTHGVELRRRSTDP